MTSEAPERIWAQCDTKNHIAELAELGVKPVPEVKASFVEYIRADHALALVAEAYEAATNEASETSARCEKKEAADAIVARKARDRKVREEALREAAGLFTGKDWESAAIRETILVLIEGDTST